MHDRPRLALILLLLGVIACAVPEQQREKRSSASPEKTTVVPAAPETTAVVPTTPKHEASTSPVEEQDKTPESLSFDFSLDAIIRHLGSKHDTATGELYSNVIINQSDGKWVMIGCQAPDAGSCMGTGGVFPLAEQQSELKALLQALDRMLKKPANRSCCRILDHSVQPFQPGDYFLHHKNVTYRGSIKYDGPDCPPRDIARWLQAHFPPKAAQN